MKSLIKLTVAVIILTTPVESIAQIFGIKAGLNLSNMFFESEFDVQSFEMNPGYHAGLTAEFPVTDLLSFEAGLLLSTKGGKYNEEETSIGETEKHTGKLNLYYLDVPATARAYIGLGGLKVFGVLGPYAGIGIGGKNKSEYTYSGVTEKYEEEIEFGSDKHFKRLDFGLTAGAGIEAGSVYVGVNYKYGLANVYPAASTTIIKHRVLGMSAGYKFGKK